jgi:NAD(P)-dependent dehydrogenase (short-subunit alcohol dehydrogenase family)
VIAHLHGDCVVGAPVRLTLRLDRAGQGVLLALPATDTPHMEDDRIMRELGCDPKFRRVLITDGRGAVGQALAHAFAAAGAAEIFVGHAPSWLAAPDLPGTLVPLDVTDSQSVRLLAARIGGKVDILVNCASQLRPGDGIVAAQEAMQALAFGLLRLAAAFGPAMRARGADGVDNAVAWVNLLSLHAYAAQPGFGAVSAAMAAALSVARTLRTELRPGGVRVLDIVAGPIDDDWHQAVPPPKLPPAALACAVVQALRDGLERAFVGDVAKDFRARWLADPAATEREPIGP